MCIHSTNLVSYFLSFIWDFGLHNKITFVSKSDLLRCGSPWVVYDDDMKAILITAENQFGKLFRLCQANHHKNIACWESVAQLSTRFHEITSIFTVWNRSSSAKISRLHRSSPIIVLVAVFKRPDSKGSVPKLVLGRPPFKCILSFYSVRIGLGNFLRNFSFETIGENEEGKAFLAPVARISEVDRGCDANVVVARASNPDLTELLTPWKSWIREQYYG